MTYDEIQDAVGNRDLDVNLVMVRGTARRGSTDVFRLLAVGERSVLVGDVPEAGWRAGMAHWQVREVF